MTWGLCAHEYLTSLEGRGLAWKSIKSMGVVLAHFERYAFALAPELCTKETVVGYIEHLFSSHFSASSQESYTHSVLRFLAWLHHRGLIRHDPGEGVKPRKQVRKITRIIPSNDEMADILNATENFRSRALFELLYSAGLRFSEALAALFADVDFEGRSLLIRGGKGNRDRYVVFGKIARDWLLLYVRNQRPADIEQARESVRDNLFVGTQGSLSWSCVDRAWKRSVAMAGFGGKPYTLHSIRHACATHLLEAGAQVRYVQELLGHASLSTTQRYTRPGVERIKATYRTHHPRENEHYAEVNAEYRRELAKLRTELLQNRAKKAADVVRQAKKRCGITTDEV